MPQALASDGFTSVGITSQQLVPSNPRRTRLRIFPSNTGRFTISFRNPVVLDSGPTITPSMPFLDLSFDADGQTVQGPVYVIASVAGTVVGWIEDSYLF